MGTVCRIASTTTTEGGGGAAARGSCPRPRAAAHPARARATRTRVHTGRHRCHPPRRPCGAAGGRTPPVGGDDMIDRCAARIQLAIESTPLRRRCPRRRARPHPWCRPTGVSRRTAQNTRVRLKFPPGAYGIFAKRREGVTHPSVALAVPVFEARMSYPEAHFRSDGRYLLGRVLGPRPHRTSIYPSGRRSA